MHSHEDKPFEEFDSFDQFFERAELRPGYWEERAKLEFTREVLSKMIRDNISRGEFASRLDVQPGMVTRLLSGRNNFELITMVRMAMALNCRFRSHLEPVGTKTMWIDVLDDEPERKETKAWNPLDFRNVEFLAPRIEEPTCESIAA